MKALAFRGLCMSLALLVLAYLKRAFPANDYDHWAPPNAVTPFTAACFFSIH